MRLRHGSIALWSASILVGVASSAEAAIPHHSWDRATVGNGFGFSVFDAALQKLTTFTEAPSRYGAPGLASRNLAYDAYFGLRAEGEAAWLGEREVPAGAMRYVDESDVVEITQQVGPLRANTYVYSPFGLSAPAVVLALEVTNTSAIAQPDAAAYALLNFHLGAGAPAPDATGEQLTYDASRDAFHETGPSGLTARYLSISPSTHHGASPKNPYVIVKGGGDLIDVADSGVMTDAVASFEWSLAGIAPGETRWVGVLITLATDDAARAYLAGRTPEALVKSELAAWEAWRKPPPAGLSDHERMVWRQSESVLRMAQVRAPAPAKGQILAALPTGVWWTTWVRDMSYAIAALARSGHLDEAGAGVDFWKGAKVGGYKSYVGRDYPVSVVRYFGDGEEESDTNADGPNIEFDGFGLSVWASHAAGRKDFDGNADLLRSLVDTNGMLKPDSSIWEVHWNGQQKHFAYSTIAGARALCDAGDAKGALGLRDALLKNTRIPSGGIAQSAETVAAHRDEIDAAVIEAIDFGLINPLGDLAQKTLASFDVLKVPSGHGYFRNQDGGGYDTEEWVFLDLRIADALERMGRHTEAAALLSWVTEQAALNEGLVPELMARENGDYTGSIPMVGFGAATYMLTLLDRASPPPLVDPCFPKEGPDVIPGPTPDAGVDASADASTDAAADAPIVTDGAIDDASGATDGAGVGPLPPLADGKSGGCSTWSARGAEGAQGAEGATSTFGAALVVAGLVMARRRQGRS